MKDAQKPNHVNLNKLIEHLREGRFVIPNFQRELKWRPSDICDLMRSIFLDYYIGSLLLWKGKQKNFVALSCENVRGFRGDGRAEYIVLDGQQRLTALYYAFLDPVIPLPNRSNDAVFFVRVNKFMNEEYDDAFQYDWLSRRVEKILGDLETQFVEHFFPLSVIGAGGWELYKWIQGYEQYWNTAAGLAQAKGDYAAKEAQLHATNANAFGEHLKGITDQYQVSSIELDQELELDKVCDIFTQINSHGVRLDVFDLVNALLVPKGVQLKNMWWDAKARLELVKTEKMNVYILQVMSILRQTYCSPKYLYFLLPGQVKKIRDPNGTRRKEILVPDINEFKERWNQAVGALERAIKLLLHPQEFGAVSSKYLPYRSILPVFAALQAHVKTCSPELRLNAQRKVRHWYWASVFTSRYSGSVESTSARDFLNVKTWIDDDVAEPTLIQEFKTRSRNMELRRETKRGTSVYNGIFNLLILQGARDWITGNIPQHDDLDDHHIVPKSWGTRSLSGNIVDTIINRTPLTADTNRNVIGDKLPNAYLPKLIEQNGEEIVHANMETHFISPAALKILLRDPFIPDDFEEFISERQRTIQDAIETLLVKERLDLPPNLRKLDEDVEKVELCLRKTVAAGLACDPAVLPPHVIQKVDERLQRAAKKNAALDMDYYQTLAGKLEYCDLRELQDAILAQSIWPTFETQFLNKEMLMSKFGQLEKLRNGIRHDRTVNEVTLKEGEAALTWFSQVQGK